MRIELSTKNKTKISQAGFKERFQLSAWVINLLVLINLTICEIIWFSPIIRKVGFYLDDWSTYSDLYNAPQNIFALVKVSLADPRIITRPIEALVYVGSWLVFHDNPILHHLLNCIFEISAAFFLYLALCRLSGNRALPFLSALFMLIYPSHDATHYWVTANTITLSLGMYLFSLWQSIKAIQDKKPFCFAYASFGFLASLLTYEAFIPFIGITVICSFTLYCKNYKWTQALFNTTLAMLPNMLSIAAVYYYQRIYLTQLRIGFHHSLAFTKEHALSVFEAGFAQTLSMEALSAYWLRIQETLFDLNVFKLFTLTLLLLLTAFTLFVIDKSKNLSHPYTFVGLGFIIMLFSYTVFAVSPEYLPTLESILNRLNTGASVGASMIIAGTLGILANIPKTSWQAKYILLALLSAPIIAFFIIADWGWSIPWIRSWTFQKYIISLVKNNKEQFQKVDSVILANCPRYVMWSPHFDGVWDFQSMLRMYSGKPKIKATVVSDRLQMNKNSIKDVSCGYLCGEYPIANLFVFIPNPQQWIEIKSTPDFIETIKHSCTTFTVSESTTSLWQKQVHAGITKPISSKQF